MAWSEQVASSLVSEIPTKQKADEVLAREFERMSIKEKSVVEKDIRGESSELLPHDVGSVADYLDRLDQEVNKMQQGWEVDTEAYDLAEMKSPRYVRRASFRLMFLRADLFDVTLAAHRLMKHFQIKRELFGDELLVTDITSDHLNAEDLAVAACGSLTILPLRDSVGRTVVINRPALSAKYKIDSVVRHFWVFSMELAQDERVQAQGFVAVAHNDGLDFANCAAYIQRFGPVRGALASRVAATHYCMEAPESLATVPIVRHFLDRSTKLRFHHHFGHRADIEKKLRQSGIPNHFPPSISLAEMMLMIRSERIQKQKELENRFWSTKSPLFLDDAKGSTEKSLVSRVSFSDTDESTASSVEITEIDDDESENSGPIIPQRFDVCFGRGRSRDHTGNRRLHHIVNMHREAYKNANRFEKTAMAERIVWMVMESGGRFLKQDEDGLGWTQVEFGVSREKVSKLFRPRKKP